MNPKFLSKFAKGIKIGLMFFVVQGLISGILIIEFLHLRFLAALLEYFFVSCVVSTFLGCFLCSGGVCVAGGVWWWIVLDGLPLLLMCLCCQEVCKKENQRRQYSQGGIQLA